MDKVTVNNQIVGMRKYVKQAKTHVINKFVKQIKSLEVKKGTDTQITKNRRKMERLLEKVKILKKIQVDFVSKSVLSKSKDWKSLIEQKDTSLQDQCLALLANYSSVQKEVEQFYSVHSNLADKIPSLIMEWEVKYKNSNKKTKKFAKRNKKENSSFPNNRPIARNTIVKSEETDKARFEEKIRDSISDSEHKSNLSASDEEKEEHTEINLLEEFCADKEKLNESIKKDLSFFTSNRNKKLLNQKYKIKESRDPIKSEEDKESKNIFGVIDVETDNDYQTNTGKFNIKTDSHSGDDDDHPAGPPSIFQKLSAIANTNFEVKKPKEKVFSNTNYQQTKCITFLDINKIKDLNEIPVENSSISKEETEHQVKPKKDSFFITSDGNSDSESEKKNCDERNNFNRNDVSKRSSFNKRTFPHTNKTFSKRKDFSKSPNQYENRSFSNNRKFRRSQNLKTSKPVFKHETSRRNSFSNYQNDNKKSPVKNNQQLKHSSLQKEKSNEPLHPSWEAKRKLKEGAKTGFKGKRILFDE